MAGTLLRIMKLFKIAVDKLQLPLSLHEVERIGILVDKAMSTEARSFHTADHIFALSDTSQPLLLLAAIFHDIIYYTIDDNLFPELQSSLDPYVELRDKTFVIKEVKDKAEGPWFQDILSIFGFTAGMELKPFGGMNEFLSTLVFYHELKTIMTREDLIIVSCCIELTIPFRGRDKQNRSPADKLAERLKKLNEEQKLNFDDEKLTVIVQQAVTFANTDVLNFSANEVGVFLDNTWKLLPETNPTLRVAGIYTVKNYRVALQKIYGFMNSLDPSIIFLSYKGVPGELDFHYLNFRAERNVIAAREYLGVKLLTIGILEAITNISGGDIPIALLMGDTNDLPSIKKFEEALPRLDKDSGVELRPAVYALLEMGRQTATSFDLNRSPLSRFVYVYLGSPKLPEYLVHVNEMFKGDMSPEDFLNQLPAKLVLSIIRACVTMTFTRRQELLKYFNVRKASKQ